MSLRRATPLCLIVLMVGCQSTRAERPQPPVSQPPPVQPPPAQAHVEAAPTSAAIPRARFIQCPDHALGASIELAADGSHYFGFARDNYQRVEYARCTHSAQEIRCDGKWGFTHDSATLVIAPTSDGALSARLELADARVAVFACVAGERALGPGCVFNPGTPACRPDSPD